MTHYGFSPKDDLRSARLLLQVGIEIVSSCYAEFFGFDLLEHLDERISDYLLQAKKAFKLSAAEQSSNPTHCFLPLGHYVMRSVVRAGNAN